MSALRTGPRPKAGWTRMEVQPPLGSWYPPSLGLRPLAGPLVRALSSTSTWEAGHHGAVSRREPLDSGPIPGSLPLSSDLLNGKMWSSHSMLRLLAYRSQLGHLPASWCGDNLTPTLAFAMMPFKIHHVPSLGPSINNIPPPGAAHEAGVVSTGHLTLDGTCPRNGDPMADSLTTWGSKCSFPWCPPSGS